MANAKAERRLAERLNKMRNALATLFPGEFGRSSLSSFKNCFTDVRHFLEGKSSFTDKTLDIIRSVAGLAVAVPALIKEQELLENEHDEKMCSELDLVLSEYSEVHEKEKETVADSSEATPRALHIHSWVLKNLHNPYPCRTMIKDLASKSDASEKYVTNTLARIRCNIGWTVLREKHFGGSRTLVTDCVKDVLFGGRAKCRVSKSVYDDIKSMTVTASRILNSGTSVYEKHYDEILAEISRKPPTSPQNVVSALSGEERVLVDQSYVSRKRRVSDIEDNEEVPQLTRAGNKAGEGPLKRCKRIRTTHSEDPPNTKSLSIEAGLEKQKRPHSYKRKLDGTSLDGPDTEDTCENTRKRKRTHIGDDVPSLRELVQDVVEPVPALCRSQSIESFDSTESFPQNIFPSFLSQQVPNSCIRLDDMMLTTPSSLNDSSGLLELGPEDDTPVPLQNTDTSPLFLSSGLKAMGSVGFDVDKAAPQDPSFVTDEFWLDLSKELTDQCPFMEFGAHSYMESYGLP